MPIEGAPDFQSWILDGESGTSRRLLNLALIPATAEIAKAFGLSRREKITFIQVLRFKNGVPCLDIRYVPAAVHRALGGRRLEHSSLLQAMVDLGYEVAAGQVEIDAHRASPEDAVKLGVKLGEPVLERRVRFTDSKGKCIVYGHSRYPSGNVYTFRVDFHHSPKGVPAERKKYVQTS